jgi:hypothetical protein
MDSLLGSTEMEVDSRASIQGQTENTVLLLDKFVPSSLKISLNKA